jgi:hypothetical protein
VATSSAKKEHAQQTPYCSHIKANSRCGTSRVRVFRDAPPTRIPCVASSEVRQAEAEGREDA